MARSAASSASCPDGALCPSCGSAIERVHRDALDRWVSIFRKVHRYRCTRAGCGWHGLVGRDEPSALVAGSALWRTRLAWFVVGVASALAAVQSVRLASRPQAQSVTSTVPAAMIRSQATPPGQDFDGEALPADDPRVAANPSPLTLLRHCAWGVPGGNRYRGTVEQALSAARLPPEIVRQISMMAERGWTRGRVEISRAGIRSVDGRRHFGQRALAMGFGRSLCFDMRVNFTPGHVEYADLYEADDAGGRTHTVMVPDVCQNVAVLGERAEREEGAAAASAPEPAPWALALAALGLLGWQLRRRRRSGAG